MTGTRDSTCACANLDPVEGITVNHGQVGDLEDVLNVDVEQGYMVVAKHVTQTCRRTKTDKGPLGDHF